MRTTLLIPLFILFVFQGNTTLKAQYAAENNEPLIHALGVAAGFTTGYGLSYRFFPNKFGVQTTFAPYSDNNRATYSIGLTLLYKISESENINLLLYQGNQYYYNKNKDNNTVSKYFNNGLGIGIEFIIQKRFSCNFMGGYAGYENFNKVNFTAEVALYYKF
jgi:hypothetical protein